MRKSAYLFFLLIVLLNIRSQEFDKIHSLKNIYIDRVYSENVEDSFYIYTKLPDGYSYSTKSYPVLYVMDGDLLFPIAAGITHYLNSGGYIPELITVGIGYGTMDWREGNQRSRDFTALASEGRPFEGGAPNYLSFMVNELIPMIDNKYRTDKENRILMGHSLGGQFVLYSLLKSPQTFSRYIASSPFIYRIKDFYHELLAQKAGPANITDRRIFISIGENEPEEEYHQTVGNLVRETKKKLPNTTIQYKILPDGEHFLNPPNALTFGLKWLFK